MIHKTHFILIFVFKGEQFINVQQNFLAMNCLVFDDAEENKLSYTSIFESYVI